jgi:hypothetical protein
MTLPYCISCIAEVAINPGPFLRSRPSRESGAGSARAQRSPPRRASGSRTRASGTLSAPTLSAYRA